MLHLLTILLLMGLSYYAWCYIHEMSHILMAKKRVGLEWYKIKLYPHMYQGSLRWAACEYLPTRPLTSDDVFAISLAPRIPDVLAVILFSLTPVFSGWFLTAWFVFWGAGVVDLINGSIGLSESSDLQKAAKAKAVSAKTIRIIGLLAAGLSITATLLGLIL